MHEYRNHWLDRFVGGPVVVSHLMAPPWSKDDGEAEVDANAAKMEADPMYVIADNLEEGGQGEAKRKRIEAARVEDAARKAEATADVLDPKEER